ncbi:MAG TPA: energy transducer TonB [Sphingomicrobium sp.]|nr:energy transducer TonB [Sphingomicrobium sp.]
MLAYAAGRPAPVERRPHPNAMLVIIAAHVAVAAAVMSVKMDLPQRIFEPPIRIDMVPHREVPPENPPQHPSTNPDSARPAEPRDVPTAFESEIELGSEPIEVGPIADKVEFPPIAWNPPPRPQIVRSAARLLTPASELKPPYPQSKLLNEEEAVLTLRLTIDANGRVVAVEPVGRADRTFLAAARSHLMAHWRYRPASEDGRAIGSTEVITLRFQLDG